MEPRYQDQKTPERPCHFVFPAAGFCKEFCGEDAFRYQLVSWLVVCKCTDRIHDGLHGKRLVLILEPRRSRRCKSNEIWIKQRVLPHLCTNVYCLSSVLCPCSLVFPMARDSRPIGISMAWTQDHRDNGVTMLFRTEASLHHAYLVFSDLLLSGPYSRSPFSGPPFYPRPSKGPLTASKMVFQIRIRGSPSQL